MKEFLIGWLVGVLLTLGTVWYFAVGRNRSDIRHAQDVTAIKLRQTVTAVEAKLIAWHLTTPEIEEELAKTGKVVRRQVSDFGATVADAATDARISAQIKGKLAIDKELSARNIAVSTTDGRVTLSGNVANAQHIAKAIALALETSGVREVASTLKVK